jgi:predicted nucleic acid-binding protein
MPVVSNTSPLLNLAIIDHLFLLPQQFGPVLIPQAVLAELKVNQALPGSNALRTALNEGWLIPQSVSNKALVSLLRQELHQGESEAIALAVEVSAEKILLDEKEPP